MRANDRSHVDLSGRVLDPSLARVVANVRRAAPRVQCLTNTVAQAITANVLHAVGAGASMATHPNEVGDMSASASAVLVNLGTPDPARVAAVALLAADTRMAARPLVLDPVFVHASPLRLALARQLMSHPRLIVKGNATEVRALQAAHPDAAASTQVWITTGPTNSIVSNHAMRAVPGGHPWMAAVTGLGCALGAVIAACAAVTRDDGAASAAALALFADAGRQAGTRSEGPGSFAVAFIDALHHLSTEAAP